MITEYIKNKYIYYIPQYSHYVRLEFIITRFGDKTIKCKEIHSEGKQFDIGDGKKFNSVEDLINYYKKNSLTVSGGARILLDKVI